MVASAAGTSAVGTVLTTGGVVLILWVITGRAVTIGGAGLKTAPDQSGWRTILASIIGIAMIGIGIWLALHD